MRGELIVRKYLGLLSISFLFLGTGMLTTYAEESGGYTIEGVPNSHQLDSNVGYFYLHEEVAGEDSVKVKLINTATKEKTLEVRVTNANTNTNGLIDYTGSLKDHPLLKYPLTSIAKPKQKKINVPAKSTVETDIEIKMPNKPLLGVIVGGITVSEKQEEGENQKKLSLTNTYNYTLGLVLTNANKGELNKNVSVELENVKPILFDGRKIVQASILNPNPYVFPGATVKGEVLKESNQELVKKKQKQGVNIAPYSVYPFQLDWEKDELKPGKYIFRGTVEAAGKTWKLEKDFEITSDKANAINRDSVYKVVIPQWCLYSVYGLLIFTVSGTIYLLLRKKEV